MCQNSLYVSASVPGNDITIRRLSSVKRSERESRVAVTNEPRRCESVALDSTAYMQCNRRLSLLLGVTSAAATIAATTRSTSPTTSRRNNSTHPSHRLNIMASKTGQSYAAWYRRLLLGCASLSGLLGSVGAPITVAGNQLTESTWDKRVTTGLWFVEHYSPFCGHCKKFAPTWAKLVEVVEPWQSRGLRLGQVDCIAQGDLCARLEVKYYPFLQLYEDGKPLLVYDGDRSIEALTAFLDGKSVHYMSHNPVPPAPPPAEVEAAAALLPETDEHGHGNDKVVEQNVVVVKEVVIDDTPSEPTKQQPKMVKNPPPVKKGPVPGAKGEVISLTKEMWLNHTSSDSNLGPVFIKYFAPWCGHCKSLKPIWEDLAQLLKGLVNVAEFNCDDSDKKGECTSEGIRGFPTLTFYQDGSKVDYRGARSLTQMEAFARKAAAATGVRDVSPNEVQHAIHDEQVFFLFLYPRSTPSVIVKAVQDTAKSYLGLVTVFKSDSFDLFDRFGMPHAAPSLLVFKEYEEYAWSHIVLDPAVETATATKSQINNWIKSNKLSVVPELTSSNYEEIMRRNVQKLVVVNGISVVNDGVEEAERKKKDLIILAKQWHKSQEARDVHTAVQWVWVDADLWKDWLSTMYSVKSSQSSPVIIADPLKSEYYDVQFNGNLITHDSGSIFSTLVAIELGKVEAKSSRSFPQAVTHKLSQLMQGFANAVVYHPYMSAIVGLIAVVLLGKLVHSTLLDSSDRSSAAHTTGYRPPATKAD